MACVAAALLAQAALAETLRVATFNAELERKGPGLLLRDIEAGDAQVLAVARVIARMAPDVLVLTGFDYDHENRALEALNRRVAAEGHEFSHVFAARPNSGMATGLDLDGDGRLGGAGDAQGFGRFAGQGGMAVLSRFPLGPVRDLSGLVWARLPWATLPELDGRPFFSEEARAVQRLSGVAHWVVPVRVGQKTLNVMAFHASPPVFDGPEDRNGRRNHDEIMLWRHLLDGDLGAVPTAPFVIAGDANLDPVDGEGIKAAIRGLLADERITDPSPESEGAREAGDPEHGGDPALDTADWPGPDPGNLRVDYVLPSRDLMVEGAGVFWPAPGQSGHDLAIGASRHRLVWVDLRF